MIIVTFTSVFYVITSENFERFWKITLVNEPETTCIKIQIRQIFQIKNPFSVKVT